jgi:hypothetical protein
MSVSASSAEDIWAVGYIGGKEDTRNLAIHWDGKAWQIVTTPNPNLGANYLESVVALAPDNAWAVGDSSYEQKLNAIILHWDGETWTPMSLGFLEDIPNPSLYSISASSATDLWAAGVMGGNRDAASLIIHGDGANWSVHKTGSGTRMAVDQTSIRHENILYSIKARSAKDVWAVGEQVGTSANARVRDVQLHWNGQNWQDEALPASRNLFLTEATDVALPPGNSRFVVGNFKEEPGILHSNGEKTEMSGTDMRVLNSNYLTGIVAFSDTDAWVVGYGESREGVDLRPLIGRTVDGHTWSVVGDAPLPDAGNLNDVAGIPGTAGDVVMVGSTNGAPLVIMHRDMCAAPPSTPASPATPVTPVAATPSAAPTFSPTPIPGETESTRTFPETGKSVKGIFLDYWDKHGGLAQQGFPISEMFTEVSTLDSKSYTVQYFERAVFEYHPENQPPYNVLLSQLGTFRYRQKYPNGAPGQQPNTSTGSVLFPETGKRVGGKFLEYWQKNGGLAQQGYPVSEEFTEKSELDGKEYRVQYFERAVFELHPENQAPYDVLLSQLGTFQYKQKYGGR